MSYSILVGCDCATYTGKQMIPDKQLIFKGQSDKFAKANPEIIDKYMLHLNPPGSICYKEPKAYNYKIWNYYEEWREVARKSIDYIWLAHCPLMVSADTIESVLTIINNALPTLKDGGQIILKGYHPKMLNKDIEKDLINLQSGIAKFLPKKDIIKVGLIYQKDLPFILTSKIVTNTAMDFVTPDSYYIVITKMAASGGKKKKHTRRQLKRNKTLKNKK